MRETIGNMAKKNLEPSSRLKSYSEWDLNPHGLKRPQDFKSCASTNSAIRARHKNKHFAKNKKTKGSLSNKRREL